MSIPLPRRRQEGPAPTPKGEMSLIEHLEELRRRIIKMAIAYCFGAVVAWGIYDPLLALLVRPLSRVDVASEILSGGRLIFTAPTEAFFVRLKVTAFAALLIALPVILFQLWRFVAPGLYSHEKRYTLPFVGLSLGFFAGGAALAFYTLPQALNILAAFAGNELVLIPRASEYLGFVLVLVAAFGLAFEFPLVLLALTLAGVLDTGKLKRGRRVAWVAILIASAFITPTQDPITLLILAIPLAVLYEVTILVAWLLLRRREGRLAR